MSGSSLGPARQLHCAWLFRFERLQGVDPAKYECVDKRPSVNVRAKASPLVVSEVIFSSASISALSHNAPADRRRPIERE